MTEHAALNECVAATHVPVSDMALRDRALRWNAAVVPACQNLRMLGSCVRTQAKVAQGSVDFYYEYGPHPWDVGAACVILREAGGIITRLDGKPFDYGRGGVLATNAAAHDAAVRLLNDADGHMDDFMRYPG